MSGQASMYFHIYITVLTRYNNRYLFHPDGKQSGVWNTPSSWTSGDRPVIYRSFDNDDSIQLMNGAEIVPGKVRLTY